MRLKEIPLGDIFAGKNWVVTYNSEEDMPNPLVSEAVEFKVGEAGAFAAVCKFADGSEHPCLAVKLFDEGGHTIQTFVYTLNGWMESHADGFFRAVGKYAHDVFPYDVFLATPWKGDAEIGAQVDQHRKVFADALPRLKLLKYEPRTTKRRLL